MNLLTVFYKITKITGNFYNNMRRKMRFGIYSNATIKKCWVCKGVAENAYRSD